MPRLRRRAAGLTFGAAVLFAVGTSVQAGWILLLAALLLGCVFVGIVLPVFVVRGVDVERRAPGEAFQGDEVEVELIVTNWRPATKLGLELDDRHLSRTLIELPACPPQARVAVGGGRGALRRGVATTSGVSVRSSWPFGVATARRRVPAESRTIVYPAVEPLGEIPLIAWTRTYEHSVHTAPRRGSGPDYLGIREYRAGDSMRHVHWPSTARTGQVMVREFEHEETRRLAIVVDTSADVGRQGTPLDRCCSVAASVALAALAGGRGVRLFAARDGALETINRVEPPRILEWLAVLRGFGGLTVAEVCGHLVPELRGIETVLLVLPSWRTNRDAVARIASLTDTVPIVAVALVSARTHAADDGREAPALTGDEEDSLVGELTAARISVYRITRGEALSACLDRPLVPA